MRRRYPCRVTKCRVPPAQSQLYHTGNRIYLKAGKAGSGTVRRAAHAVCCCISHASEKRLHNL